MTDDEIKSQIDATVRRVLREELAGIINFSNRLAIAKDIEIAGSGMRIGTAGNQRLSVYGVAPTVQQAPVTAPAGGATVDSQSRTAINAIILAIKTFGITL